MYDIRTDLLTREQWEERCATSIEAFYTPPEQFLFHHYDDPSKATLICTRPMVGIERYRVDDAKGGFYGLYDTRDVTFYLKSGTWVQVEEGTFFIDLEIASLERQLEQKRTERHAIAAAATQQQEGGECRSAHCECEPGKCGSGRIDKRGETNV